MKNNNDNNKVEFSFHDDERMGLTHKKLSNRIPSSFFHAIKPYMEYQKDNRISLKWGEGWYIKEGEEQEVKENLHHMGCYNFPNI